ncbi:MAG: dihydrofolate reductase [Nocardioides sp.]|uniref:dihydrofolate reductase n=1 Tax=Nocardioides sp. TaxID=35761 RepID=UPI0039E42BAF
MAAVAAGGVIGDRSLGAHGGVPWHLPAELAGFRELTWGHPLLMGRTTYESIGRPLPGRTSIVLTRDPEWRRAGVLVAHDLDEALALAAALPDAPPSGGDLMVIGGAEVYAETLPLAGEQILSEIALRVEGDVCYPAFDRAEWTPTRRVHGEGYDRVWWRRAGRGTG